MIFIVFVVGVFAFLFVCFLFDLVFLFDLSFFSFSFLWLLGWFVFCRFFFFFFFLNSSVPAAHLIY